MTERPQTEAALRASEARFRALFEHASDLISIVDTAGVISYASPSYQTLLGYAPAALRGHSILALVHPEDLPRARRALAARAENTVLPQMIDLRVRHADGSWRTLEVLGANRVSDPAVGGIILTGRDNTVRVAALEALRASERRFRSLTESAADAIVVADQHSRIVAWNRGAETIFGYPEAESVGQEVRVLMPARYHTAHQQGLERVTRTGQGRLLGQVVELVGRRSDGTEFPLELSLATWTTVEGPFYSAIMRDITARARLEESLRHQSLHDALTDLPNRHLLRDRVEQALRVAQRERVGVALLLLDLDRFKEVNDTFGHPAGDLLLQEVAQRLRGAVRGSDTVARLGGDEFALLLTGVDRAGALAGAAKIHAALEAPVRLGEQAVHVEGSLGIALGPTQGEDAATLLRHADVAMYQVKAQGEDYAVYAPEQDPYTPERLALIGELGAAIATGDLRLHYQPQVELTTGRVAGVEALVRWAHPVRGAVWPDQFIPLAEHTGLIMPLTLWVLGAALRQAQRWGEQGRALDVAVNLSTRTLQDLELPATVARLVAQSGVPPQRLTLEITESALMANPARAQTVLTQLGALGVRLSIDDFGTGYSSLGYLKQLPVDEVKIDQSFVRALGTGERKNAAIVRSVVDLGHNLGLRVVAEGVEDEGTSDLLRGMGCDVAQGYYLSRPVPAADLDAWIAARPPGADQASGEGERGVRTTGPPSRTGALMDDEPPC